MNIRAGLTHSLSFWSEGIARAIESHITQKDAIASLQHDECCVSPVREWIADNIGYRFFGCAYNATTQPLFDYLAIIVPKQFLGRNIADLGCGDGINTVRLREIFQPKKIIGYDFLIKR